MKLCCHSFITCKWTPPLPFPRHVIISQSTTSNSSLKLALESETLKILEWPSVCTQLSNFTSTSMGLSAANLARIPLGQTPDESRRLLDQTSAALAVSRKLDFSGIYDVSRVVEDAVSGNMLSIGELCLVKGTLRSARSLIKQLKHVSSLDDRCSVLLEILKECDFLVELEQKLEFCLDCKFSVVLDRASEDLEMIRSERKRNMENLEVMLKQISSRIFQAGGSDRPLVTSRRSRLCVAIKSTRKSLLPGGVILDSSSSGATYYMEPREVVDLNNLEVRLSNSEKMEEQAILSLLSAEITESSAQIKYLLDRVLELDLAFARAAHAQWINGVCPFFSSEMNSLSVDVDGMQHPLLLESSLSQHADVSPITSPVPVDFKIGDGVKVVVISGPNTGGKTASMKTLGLASIMLKAGMYIPAQNNPQLPWFDLVLADIGDQQSLEQSLSTFSGHISRIRKILEVTSERSLVLLDEIGSGTDPSEGMVLSASILQYLKERVNLAVVTTHYADLTRLKEKDARFENAAMEFSLESLQPTYKILWGSMGESNALSIASAIGFNGKIIERAQYWVKKLTPGKMQKFNSSLYQSLSEERSKLGTQTERATSLYSDTLQLYNEIAEEAGDLDVREAAGDLDVREAALKANETQRIREELKDVKSKIDNIVQEFENQLSMTSTDKFSTLLKKAESDIALITQAHQPFKNTVDDNVASSLHVPNIGEQVVIKGFGSKLATVIEAPAEDNTVLVRLGKITVRVNLSSVKALADGSEATKSPRPTRQGQRTKRLKNLKSLSDIGKEVEGTYGAAVQTSKNSVDLRGMRVEEATLHVNMAINGRGSRSVVFIIHGMGTGVLKERVHEVLRKHPRIEKFEQESPLNYGCTIAYIK